MYRKHQAKKFRNIFVSLAYKSFLEHFLKLTQAVMYTVPTAVTQSHNFPHPDLHGRK
jgi:hypothetical protein